MPETLQPTIRYAEPSPVRPFQRAAMSRLSFEETLAQLKAAILAEDLWLIHEIDPCLLAARGGFGILPARQLLFFHPRYLVRLLETDPGALLEAPLKIAVLALPDGTIMVRMPYPVAVFERYPGLSGLGEELGVICERLLATVSA